MDDGSPIRFCDETHNSIESYGYSGGLMDFLRHHVRHPHPDDMEHKLPGFNIYSSHGDLKSITCGSTSSSDSFDGSSEKQTTGSNVPGMGRSLTWATFRGTGMSNEKSHSNLPAVLEATNSVAGANQLTLSSSQSYQILPAASSFASLPPSGEQRATEKASFTIGDKSATYSHSIFGLPPRIKVTKRELNMMTPSSF